MKEKKWDPFITGLAGVLGGVGIAYLYIGITNVKTPPIYALPLITIALMLLIILGES